MNPAAIKELIINDLKQKNMKVATVSVDRLVDVKADLKDLLLSGEFNLDANKDVAQYQYRYEKVVNDKQYDYDYHKDLKGAKSIIIVTFLEPLHQVGFTLDGKLIEVIIPTDYRQRARKKVIDDYLKKTMTSFNHQAFKIRLPLKLLAVRSGLAEYGRNNISYIEGFGSKYSLVAYYTDVELPEDDWRVPVRMKLCDTCRICLNNCPTGAIVENKKVILAERCLSLYNGYADDIPEWIDKDSHNSLIDCVNCMEKCPMNIRYNHPNVKLPAFNESQTKEIFSTKNFQDLSAYTYKIIHEYEIDEYYDVLHRNISLLMSKMIDK